MTSITLLSSFHRTLGKCNADELYRIIESIQPDVIFEELPIDIFANLYLLGYAANSLEAKTIKRYLIKYPIKHIAVDTYPKKPEELLFNANIICDASKEYQKLWEQELVKIEEDGYTFINSDDCFNIIDKLRLIEKTVVAEAKNLELQTEYEAELRLHDNRENIMLANIYKYSISQPFNNGLFICGAEHRRPLMEKIKIYKNYSNTKLNWNFYGT